MTSVATCQCFTGLGYFTVTQRVANFLLNISANSEPVTSADTLQRHRNQFWHLLFPIPFILIYVTLPLKTFENTHIISSLFQLWGKLASAS